MTDRNTSTTSMLNRHFNPSPHGLKAVAKAAAIGLKQPLIPHPPVGGEGGRGCLLCRPEDLL
jgi:hypothetical protein